MYEILEGSGMALLRTTSASLAARTSGVDRVVITGDGTFTKKSKGLPDLPPLSDLWCDSERFEEGAHDRAEGLAIVAQDCLVEGGIE